MTTQTWRAPFTSLRSCFGLSGFRGCTYPGDGLAAGAQDDLRQAQDGAALSPLPPNPRRRQNQVTRLDRLDPERLPGVEVAVGGGDDRGVVDQIVGSRARSPTPHVAVDRVARVTQGFREAARYYLEPVEIPLNTRDERLADQVPAGPQVDRGRLVLSWDCPRRVERCARGELRPETSTGSSCDGVEHRSGVGVTDVGVGGWIEQIPVVILEPDHGLRIGRIGHNRQRHHRHLLPRCSGAPIRTLDLQRVLAGIACLVGRLRDDRVVGRGRQFDGPLEVLNRVQDPGAVAVLPVGPVIPLQDLRILRGGAHKPHHGAGSGARVLCGRLDDGHPRPIVLCDGHAARRRLRGSAAAGRGDCERALDRRRAGVAGRGPGRAPEIGAR